MVGTHLSCAAYEKLVGKSPVEEISTVNDDIEIFEPAAKKARVSWDYNVTNIFDKLCDMEKGVNSINEKLALIDDKRSLNALFVIFLASNMLLVAAVNISLAAVCVC